MREAAEHIQKTITELLNYTFFNGFIDIPILTGLYWELAPEAVILPFGTYSLEQLPGASKDYPGDYILRLYIWAGTINEAADLAEFIKTDLQDLRKQGLLKWRFTGMKSGYSSTDAKEGFIEINYTLKSIENITQGDR